MAGGDRNGGTWKSFRGGVLAGLLFGLLVIGIGIYVLNMLGIVVVSVTHVPGIQDFLHWAYANLRLSVIPFAAILVLYGRELRRLNRLVRDPEATVEQVTRSEKWVDSSASLFFGVGVIWTAIGMRSALLFALGDLNQTMAAQLGAFEILRRLVNGGILLALSTTIVGAVGGYLMRLGKTLAVGAKLEEFHDRLADAVVQQFDQRLASIESHVATLSGQAVAGEETGQGHDSLRRGRREGPAYRPAPNYTSVGGEAREQL